MRTPPRPVEPWSHIVRLDEARAAKAFDLDPSSEARTALAERLGIPAVRKLRFAGHLVPEGRRDWRLEAELGATVVQSCVVTLAPVTTRIEETVERHYLAEFPELPGGEEVEMLDDSVEPLPAALDLGAVMAEALVLALPPWPRAEGAELADGTYAEPGTRPMTDEDARPFAGLAGLLRNEDDET